jgi:hypothetical protein
VRGAAMHVVATHPYPDFRHDLRTLLDDKKEAARLRGASAYIRLQRGAEESLPGVAPSLVDVPPSTFTHHCDGRIDSEFSEHVALIR